MSNQLFRFFVVFACLCMMVVNMHSQTGNTVGLLLNEDSSYNGYTLLTPTTGNMTYLLDNCGYIANSWESEYGPGLGAHLSHWGTLIRTGRIPNDFQAGGSGGLIQEFDWDGKVIWEAEVSSPLIQQHHDVKPMPNGNILVLAWEYNSAIDAMLLGRDPALITEDGIWTEALLEIQRVGDSDYTVVWEWHLNDHLVQDIDASLANYGKISENPQLIDINYIPFATKDLFHANALDYNEERDQIVINFRDYSEFYIIDHSTSSEEAAGHTGGNAGKGGDILYRYGNPKAYDRGLETDQKFFSQHGANWIKEGIYKDQIIVFNNGVGRPQGIFSSVEIVEPTWNGIDYDVSEDSAFGPDVFSFAYVGSPTSDFFSPRISNATVLPNDNILICNGGIGQLFEINQAKEKVWEYINPALGNNIAEQGEANPESNVFATHRYGVDFTGLPDEISVGNPIELNSFYECEISPELVNVAEREWKGVSLRSNPVEEQLIIINDKNHKLDLTLFDLYGRTVMSTFTSSESTISKSIDVMSGYYLLQIQNQELGTKSSISLIKK